jgi:excinuclease UvrABC nuclease subunit
MGEKRLDALLQAFGSMEKLKSATYDELIKYVPGETARSIISYFASGGFSE